MVALSIMALLALLSWRGLDAMVRAQQVTQERGERLTILGLGAVSGYTIVALWILAIAGSATVAYRFAVAHRELARLDSQPKLGEHPG